MALGNAYVALDIYSVNLNWYYQYYYSSNFYDNANIIYDGRTYQDVVTVTGYDGSEYLGIAFGGHNIQLDSNGNVVGGTVTGIIEVNAYNNALLWSISGISLPAVQVYKAALTTSNSDDLLLIQSALSGNDKLYLSAGADNFGGFAGNDTIHAGGGNDSIGGGFGNDKLFGQGGNDVLGGYAGQDTIFGGTGSDLLLGQGGSDKLVGGGGADTLKGGGDDDSLAGNGGPDSLLGGGGADTLSGDTGNDKLVGGSGPDRFVFAGNFGHDTINSFSADNHEDIDLSQVTAIAGFFDLVHHHLHTGAGGWAEIDVGASNSILLHGITVSEIGSGLAYSGADFIL